MSLTALHDMQKKPFFPPAQWGSLSERVFSLFDDASATRGGHSTAIVMMLTIVVSTIAFVVETMPATRSRPAGCAAALAAGRPFTVALCEPVSGGAFAVIETACITVFTVDYAARLLTVHAVGADVAGVSQRAQSVERLRPRQVAWRYATQPLNLIDFLAIAPFYAELAIGGGCSQLAVVRVLRGSHCRSRAKDGSRAKDRRRSPPRRLRRNRGPCRQGRRRRRRRRSCRSHRDGWPEIRHLQRRRSQASTINNCLRL